MKRTVQIEIAGARYRMSSDAEETYLQRLAEVGIDERFQAKVDASDLVQETFLDAQQVKYWCYR